MTVQPSPVLEPPQGQAAFGMSNLRREKTGLPFVVFIAQRGGARHDVRVKTSPGPKVRADEMSSYALRPCQHKDGPRLSAQEEALLAAWAKLNLGTLVQYWEGDIAYTEDAMDRRVPV